MGLDWDHLNVNLNISSCGYSLWERGVVCSRTWLPRPFVKNNDLWIFDTGKGAMNMVNGKTPLHKNSIIWLRPGHQYIAEQDPEDPIGLIYIHFDLIKPDGSFYFPDVHEMPENFECFNHAHWCAMGRNIIRIKTLAEQKQFPGSKSDMQKTLNALLKSMLMGIELCDAITRVNNTSGKTNMIAIQAAEYLSDELHNVRSIQDIARHFGLSRNHFTRIFTGFWHMTPQDYLITQRIRRAKNLLVNSDSSIEEIADSLGYSDCFFFSRQFKEKTGMSPGAYRRQRTPDHAEKNTSKPFENQEI